VVAAPAELVEMQRKPEARLEQRVVQARTMEAQAELVEMPAPQPVFVGEVAVRAGLAARVIIVVVVLHGLHYTQILLDT